uniref:AMP-binding enzyme C-terminal domain-containing protein n=1 Tax=Bicosoecida sp. CB-2014 TaxID=1486930 RepID=A0A7S1GBW5_9STRA
MDTETGDELPAGRAGEVCVAGDSVFPGYLGDEEATAATLRADAAGTRWLHTGDVGFLSDDGYLTLTDRTKDVIISGGSNVYPREVEEVLLLHKSVELCAVFGRASEEWGEEVVVAVVADCDEDSRGTLVRELDAMCIERIARFKRPKEYFFLNELPTSAVGKVLKTELRTALAEARGIAP